MGDPFPVRFGAFELDLRTGELRKHGIRLKLQDQPFQVLQALVERPGELVTREEIQRRIWADHTFVDFDQSLNRAVNKVREALGDTAENPRYIETMARRGYRFIAPVDGCPKPLAQTAVGGRPWGKIAWVAAGVLVAAAIGLWLTGGRVPLPPPRVVPLTALPGFEGLPTFSPDGKQVAFGWESEGRGNMDIYVKIIGNVAVLRLTTDPAYDGFPAWSPDGRQIAFVRGRGGDGIYLVSPVGGPERKLADLSTACHLAWTPDGKSLLVAKQHRARPETGDGTLLLVPVETEGPPREFLAPPRGAWFRDPAFAPDGRSLAFASCTGAEAGPICSLQVVELHSGLLPLGKLRQITKPSGDIRGIAWAPDGASLIYAIAIVEPRPYLWHVSVRNGGTPERLELAGGGALYPVTDWKSGRLAFQRMLMNTNLWRLEPGGKPAPFLTSSGAEDRNPQYSPDGRHIAFESSRQIANLAVWVANADGTEPAQITNTASPWSGTPRWSPDGRWLAFDSWEKGGVWDVWVVEARGSSPRQLTHGPADNVVPSWSRDGNSIYFASKRSGRFEIWRIPAGGGTAVQVTRNGGYTAFESTDGKTLYHTSSAEGSEGLYAKLLPDGEEKQVLKEGVAGRGFAVFSDGVYYLHFLGRYSYDIRFCSFAGGQTHVVGDIGGGSLSLGLAVSPDRKTFLFTKTASVEADLMLLENFR